MHSYVENKENILNCDTCYYDIDIQDGYYYCKVCEEDETFEKEYYHLYCVSEMKIVKHDLFDDFSAAMFQS